MAFMWKRPVAAVKAVAVRKLSVLHGADSCGHAVKRQSVNAKTFQTCMRREGRKERGLARKRERNGQRDEERERDRGRKRVREADFRLRKTPKFSPEELTMSCHLPVPVWRVSACSGRTRECSPVRTQMQGFTCEVKCSLLCPKFTMLCSAPHSLTQSHVLIRPLLS